MEYRICENKLGSYKVQRWCSGEWQEYTEAMDWRPITYRTKKQAEKFIKRQKAIDKDDEMVRRRRLKRDTWFVTKN